MPVILGVGNSHMDCVRGALSAAPQPDDGHDYVTVSMCDPRCMPLWQPGDGEIEYSPRFVDAVREAVAEHPGRPLLCFWTSRVFVINALVQPDRPFDFVLPDLPEYRPDPARELVPFDLVNRMVREQTRPGGCLPAVIRRFFDGPIYSVCAPPPTRDTTRVKELLSTVMSPALERRAHRRGIPETALRMKLWHLAIGVVREQARAQGCVFLEPPAESMDADGFLRPGLENDAYHGNIEYGRLLLRQFAQRLREDGHL